MRVGTEARERSDEETREQGHRDGGTEGRLDLGPVGPGGSVWLANSDSRSASVRLLLAIPRASRQAATLRLLASRGSSPACSSSSHIHSQPKLDSRITGIRRGHPRRRFRSRARSSCSSRCLHVILPSAFRAVTVLRRWARLR